MNIAFYDGILLQVNLHNGKATILSKQQAGTDSIDFYNYFTKHRPSPEEPLLELSNFPANEAIIIISGQPLVNQFFSDYIDTSQENNQATAKEALAYTHNLVQNAFSDIDAALAMHSGVNAEGFEGNQMLFGADQFTMVFALLDNQIVPVYTVKDLYEYIFLDFYYSNLSPDSTKKIAICPCCKKAFRLSYRNKVYCGKYCKDKSIRANNRKDPYYAKYRYLQQYNNRRLNNMCRHMTDSSPQAQKLREAYNAWNELARSEYERVSGISDHMQQVTVEEFGEFLKERWKALTKDLK